jgi:hypothetical protein
MDNDQLEKQAAVTPEAPKKKEPPKIKPPPPKYYYDVKVECMLPATLTYRILAETPEQASEMIKGRSPNTVQHRLGGRKELKLSVYDAGSVMIRFVKRLLG